LKTFVIVSGFGENNSLVKSKSTQDIEYVRVFQTEYVIQRTHSQCSHIYSYAINCRY
jgi:hypothetical protein